jgi:hypothetical protein
MPSTISSTLGARIPNADLAELRELAEKLHRTPSSLTALAIRRILPDLRRAAALLDA